MYITIKNFFINSLNIKNKLNKLKYDLNIFKKNWLIVVTNFNNKFKIFNINKKIIIISIIIFI